VKRCTSCGESKPFEKFHLRAASKDGRKPICKLCAIAKQKARHRAKNPPRNVACKDCGGPVSRKKVDAFLCLACARKRAEAIRSIWRVANPEYGRAHYARHRSAYLERVKLARIERPEQAKTYAANRRARVRNAEGKLTLVEWREILTYFGNRCAYCLEPLAAPTRDHVIPVARGGKHVAANIVPACNDCNGRKQARTLLQIVACGIGVVSNSRPREV
jgi:5-methylcytosine-specific restriction endonuclease McrA